MTYDELLKIFLSRHKSLLISPAGYGKTYTIVECVKKAQGKSLILTHTHAGIAAIKKKLFSANISKDKYQVETITSYAQKYVKSFYVGELPAIDEKNYWQFILEKAESIFKISHIREVIHSTYNNLFVDEYQDCTISQHKMILALAEILPTHILGDPLQGIMEFDKNDKLVDFTNNLKDFEILPELDIPHRWYQEGNNRQLGDFLKEVRAKLIDDIPQSIDLKGISNDIITVVKTNEEIYDTEFLSNPENRYKKCIKQLINNPNHNPIYESLLILVPEYPTSTRPRGTITDRANLKNIIDFNHQLELLEAIDGKDFYNLAKDIDTLISSIHNARLPVKNIKEKVLEKLFNKTVSVRRDSGLSGWIKSNSSKQDDSIVKKQDVEAKQNSKILSNLFSCFIEAPSSKSLYCLLKFLKDNLKLKSKRISLLRSALDCLCVENAESVYKAMINQRNRIRRVGRKVEGKCLGTTALTKGLEFDTVVILDAHNFTCPKNLYVALTRASKKLIIFSKTLTLTFRQECGNLPAKYLFP